jgi:vacuolar-type H+-ATPase subunit F/Vma7
MSDVHVVGSSVACAGFSLAGLATHEAATPRDAASVIDALVSRDETGILLVEQPVLDALDPVTERALSRRTKPIIVPFPGPTRRDRERAPESLILQLLQRAIGYRVRL